MKTVLADGNKAIVIGRLGENNHVRVEFNVAEWLGEMPNATISLFNQRPKGTAAYPVAGANIELAGTKLLWTITDADLTETGSGQCELVAIDTANNVVAKSVIYSTRILPALDDSGETPEPWDSWQEEFIRIEAAAQSAVEDAEEAVAHYPRIGADGYWYVWDTAQEDFVSTGTKAQGEKGDDGSDYVLTAADKREIADIVVAEIGLNPAEGVGF